MKTHIVAGLGYGDEGKGLVTSSLVSSLQNPLVVRFNGGHQAGHTVVAANHLGGEGKRHVFSNFGSGTLHGAHTYWSKYCTFDPVGVYNEYCILRNLGIEPVLYVDPECSVVTEYDKLANLRNKEDIANGTCGVGFGATLQRDEDYFHLLVRDLFYPKIYKEKIRAIRAYYATKGIHSSGAYHTTIMNIEAIIDCQLFQARQLKAWTNAYSDIIFEGAQGIMLDQTYGFFPNVTRSNTTTQNAREIINDRHWNEPTVYYITRAYQTRHGNGYMSNEDKPVTLKNNENETNKSDGIQGKFRTGVLDLDLLDYALACDRYIAIPERKYLCITCLDQIGDMIPFTMESETNIPNRKGSAKYITEKLDFDPIHELITFNSPITKKLF